MIGLMTALLFVLFQLSCPRNQRAKDTQFQLTCILCRDSNKTQVWFCFLILSFLGTCPRAGCVTPTEDLQTCLNRVKDELKKSDAMLYTPSLNKIQDKCEYMALNCYMLELIMVIEEEIIAKEEIITKASCFPLFHEKNKDKNEGGCPACETYSLQNITIFIDELNRILEKMNSQAG